MFSLNRSSAVGRRTLANKSIIGVVHSASPGRSRSVLRVAILTIVATVAISGCTRHADLVVFGDSYSDTGNLPVPPGVPYLGTRMSNGLVIAEHLAAHLDTKADASMHVLDCKVGMCAGYNYAVLGAKIGLPGNDHFAGQVSCYLERTGDADPDAVYFVLIGGNDVRMMNTSLTDAQAILILDPLVTTLIGQLDTLVKAGAKKFVVANMGNMGRLPSSLAAGNVAAGRLEDFSFIFNGILATKMATFKSLNPTADIHIFNLFNAMNDILDNALSSLGYVNSTDGCYDKLNLLSPYFTPCSSPTVDSFVFIDPGGHATQKTNVLLWERLRDEVIIPAGW